MTELGLPAFGESTELYHIFSVKAEELYAGVMRVVSDIAIEETRKVQAAKFRYEKKDLLIQFDKFVKSQLNKRASVDFAAA